MVYCGAAGLNERGCMAPPSPEERRTRQNSAAPRAEPPARSTRAHVGSDAERLPQLLQQLVDLALNTGDEPGWAAQALAAVANAFQFPQLELVLFDEDGRLEHFFALSTRGFVTEFRQAPRNPLREMLYGLVRDQPHAHLIDGADYGAAAFQHYVAPLFDGPQLCGLFAAERPGGRPLRAIDLAQLSAVAPHLQLALQLVRRRRPPPAADTQPWRRLLADWPFDHTLDEIADAAAAAARDGLATAWSLLFLPDEQRRLRPCGSAAAVPDLPQQLAPPLLRLANLAAGSGGRLTEQLPGDWFVVAIALDSRVSATAGAFVCGFRGRRMPPEAAAPLNDFAAALSVAVRARRAIDRAREQQAALTELLAQRSAQAQRARAIYRLLFERLPDGLVLLDGDEHVVSVNGAFAGQIVVTPAHELIGRPYQDLIALLERAAPLAIEPVNGPARRKRLRVRQASEPTARSFLVERLMIDGSDGSPDHSLEVWRRERARRA
jgi:PAS domain-containing protein